MVCLSLARSPSNRFCHLFGLSLQVRGGFSLTQPPTSQTTKCENALRPACGRDAELAPRRPWPREWRYVRRRGGQRVHTCAGSVNSQSQAFTALVVKVLSEKESVCRVGAPHSQVWTLLE